MGRVVSTPEEAASAATEGASVVLWQVPCWSLHCPVMHCVGAQNKFWVPPPTMTAAVHLLVRPRGVWHRVCTPGVGTTLGCTAMRSSCLSEQSHVWPELLLSPQARHGEVPDAAALEAAKQQMRGGGIPLLVGATAVESPETVRALAASGVDGFATPFRGLQELAEAADPDASRDSPEDCVASVLGAPLAANIIEDAVVMVWTMSSASRALRIRLLRTISPDAVFPT